MATIRKNYIIVKRNVLNELRAKSMTLQELRFFCIYLSKINPDDASTRVVRFSISDFAAIMELDSRIKLEYMKRITDGLLSKVVHVPDEHGGYMAFQLFKRCIVKTNEQGEWVVEIDAHDDALPLMFEFRSHFFSYQLWNALRLKSSNQLRMYEILKQYEKIGSRVIEFDELKELLGIAKNEYVDRFNNFKIKVLDSCQEALMAYTDITFTYEPYGKKGKGGKILALKFVIKRNENHADPLSLSEFIEEYNDDVARWDMEPDAETLPSFDKKIEFLAGACNNEFSSNEIVVLFNDMRRKLPNSLILDELQCFDYLYDKYHEMVMRNEKSEVKNRFAYLRSIIGKDYDPDI